MVLPLLHPRVKEPNPGNGEKVGALVQIAESTSIRKVLLGRRPSMLLSNYVVNVMTELCFRPKAILTCVSGTLGYDGPECGGNLHA